MRARLCLKPLVSCLAAALAFGLPTSIRATTRTVTNCANTGVGSLRSAIASAASGDTVVFDTGQMNCSTITLTSGEIEIDVDQLTVQGPVASTLTIGGFHASRVFHVLGVNHGRHLTIDHLTIVNGKVLQSADGILLGGCILTSGDLALSASTISGCEVINQQASGGHAAGGGLAAYTLHMQDSVVTNNQATGGYGFTFGGGVFTQDETVIRTSTISNNKSASLDFLASGGGFASQAFYSGSGGVQIVSSTISGNETDIGGGIIMFYGASPRAIAIDHSTISGNKAHRYAGGIVFYDSPSQSITATIVDSTISGNRGYAFVGGILNRAMLTVSNSTIAFNRAENEIFNTSYHQAAGLCTYTAVTLQSSIIAKNTVGPTTGSDLNGPFGPVISGGHNLVMVTLADTAPLAGTLTGDPMLAVLANNGGPTLTHALPSAGPAFGAGNNLLHLASDQRGSGFARSTNGATDIGSFQTGDGIFFSGFD